MTSSSAASPDDELHDYFSNVAAARYVIRKVFRLIDEHARSIGLEPLEHQALIQLFGAPGRTLQMKDLAERLDVGPDVASKLVSALERSGYAQRSRDRDDRRAINVAATAAAERRLAEIDVRVREDISLLQRDWSRAVQLAALETFAFYTGLAVDPEVLAGIEVRRISVTPPWDPSGSSGQK